MNMKMMGGNSYRNKSIIASILITMSVLLAYSMFQFWYGLNSYRDDALRDLETQADMMAANSTAGLLFGEFSSIEHVLKSFSSNEQIVFASVLVVGDQGQLEQVAAYTRNPQTLIKSPRRLLEVREVSGGNIRFMRPIVIDEESLGWIYIKASYQARVNDYLSRFLLVFIISILLAALVTTLFSISVQGALLKPVARLLAVTRKVAEDKKYDLRVEVGSDDEFGVLTANFNEMLDRIEEQSAQRNRVEIEMRELNKHLEEIVTKRTTQLETYNYNLKQAMQELKSTQSQMVESEKMASLGGLVAGVAHEINTPVGIGVTAATHLRTKIKDLKLAYTEQTLSPQDLEAFIEVAEDSAEIIYKNLQRGANLITSFKQVAVDQSSDAIRRFDMLEYLNEVLMSLRPAIKKVKHEIEIDCASERWVVSKPGDLAQIVTNLIMNSLIHGFEGIDKGHVKIQVEFSDSHVVLRYSDDGVGMSEPHLKKIFDPFFTTKRGEGGSGLGSHIVYNLATQALKGSIEVNSSLNKGAQFILRFPRDLTQIAVVDAP